MIQVEQTGAVRIFRMARAVLGRPVYWTAAYWIRRRKRWTRRIARDLRDIGPLAGVLLCAFMAASTIEAIERVPIPKERPAPRSPILVQAPKGSRPPALVASGPRSDSSLVLVEAGQAAPKAPSERSR